MRVAYVTVQSCFKFDTGAMCPRCLKVETQVVDGEHAEVVVLDTVAHTKHEEQKTLAIRRVDAIASARVTGAIKLNPAEWTVAERKLAFGLVPTDGDLGL